MPANRNKKFEKAKDFKSAIKRLLKELNPFKALVILSFRKAPQTWLRLLLRPTHKGGIESGYFLRWKRQSDFDCRSNG